jgi:hypothetical protein
MTIDNNDITNKQLTLQTNKQKLWLQLLNVQST